MANPRHGYNPLNPLSLHSENQYRPVIFESAGLGAKFVKESAKTIAEQAVKQLPEGIDDAQKATLKNAIEVAAERAGLDEIASNPNVSEAALKKTMQTQADDVFAKQSAKNIGEKTVKETAEEATEQMRGKFLGKGLNAKYES